MDAFAVSVSMGVGLPDLRPTQTLRLAGAFGGFQCLMPIVGYLAGRTISQNPWVAAYDHWIVFALLGFLGGKMIYEARFLDEDEDDAIAGEKDPTKSLTLVFLAIATSLDALAVGASLALLHVGVFHPALVIGLITALFSVIGVRLGRRFGAHLGSQAELIGGIALILIGLRILYMHLTGQA
jgi:putative Mn2+ efflux pump MntP